MTVMSNYYWNEYKKFLLDKKILNETLTFHQRTVYKTLFEEYEQVSSEKINFVECDRFVTPDVDYEEISIKYLHDERIIGIVNSIIDYYKDERIITTFPIIYFSDNYGVLKKGCYCIDLLKKKLIYYKENCDYIEEKKEINNYIFIFLFMNIEKSICLYKEKGYINSLIELGGIYSHFKKYLISKKINTINYSFNNQKMTHDLGLNLRKNFLIENILIKDLI